MTQLSELVRRRRKDLNMGQVVLAELAGCSTRFIHMVEHGKPSLRLDKLLDVLDVLGLALAVRGPGTESEERRSSGPSESS